MKAPHPRSQTILDILAQDGPARATTLCRASGISQATFSRLVHTLGDEIQVLGRGRSTRYARPRSIRGVAAPIPVHELRPTGETPRQLFRLHPVAPVGFWAEDLINGGGTFHDELPWYLQDLHPAGFLGHQIPRRHPDLDTPRDIHHWDADHVLRYITRHGWDLPGAFIVGDAPYTTFLAQGERPDNRVETADRSDRYPEIADDALDFGVPGSSAAGEQPKFLALRGSATARIPVLVKFSPPGSDPSSRRVADLLHTEHLALTTLREHGVPAARSEVLTGSGRTFLEVERFDREGAYHRRGTCSLEAMDAAFVGSDRSSWADSVAALVRQRRFHADILSRVRVVELFGRFIGNTDMHFENLSFHLDGVRPTGLAPVYDMLPMYYAPRHGELPRTLHVMPTPSPAWGDAALPAIDAAGDFWGRVADAPDIGTEFRRIGGENVRRIGELRNTARYLPT